MKFFTNKKFLFKLIATLCVFLALFNFCTVPSAQADAGELVSKAGGKLLDPICSLIVALGDGIMETLQKAVMGTSATAIFDNPTEGWWLTTVKNIAIVIGIVALVVATGLVSLPALLSSAAITAAKIAIGAIIVDSLTNGGVKTAVSAVSANFFGETIVLPTYTIGPEEIFSGRILLFDANIFNPKEVKTVEEVDSDGETITKYYYEKNGEKIPTSINNAAQDLKGTISKWYYVIRNIAIIGLMLVLLYVGIRILTSSIASDKAKYKQMMSDWVVALCLVFLMQYIMVFANEFVEGVTDIFANLSEGQSHVAVIKEPSDKLVKSVKEIDESYVQDDGKGGSVIAWPTNLMGQIRLAAQQRDGTSGYVGNSICYFVLVMFTIFFAFTYAKRLLYILFLTVIAPFVALTYPLDKIRDGQAQAFNMWMKEYIINLLIQPFHLLLYIIFVSMAFELAGANIIYSLVVLGFMIPAEKFLRSMFGFNKATSAGFLAGPAGAAITISAMKSLSGFAGKGPGGKGSGKAQDGASEQKNNRIRSADKGNTTDSLMRQAVGAGDDSQERGDGSNSRPSQERDSSTQNDETSASAQQRMLDAYDENYGTDEYDPTEREAMARELYATEDSGTNNYTDDEYAQILRDSGYTEDEINDMVRERNGEVEPVEEQTQETETQPEIGLEELPEETGKFKRKLQHAGGYVKARAQLFARDNINKDRAAQLVKGGLKKATTLGTGALGAGIGVAAGIASGSPGDVLKYGTAGAYAGSSIGQGVTNRTSARVEKEERRHEETLKKQYGADEYKRRKNEELDEEFMKNSQIRKKYELEFNTKNKKQLDEILTDAKEYRKYGVVDDDTIIKAMKINTNDRKDIRSIAAAKLSASAKSEKDLETTMKRFGKTPGITDKQMKDMEKRIRTINKSTLN